jgi:hypothetical protein
MPTLPAVAGNVYYHGAGPARNEARPVVLQEDPGLRIVEKGEEVYLKMTFGRETTAAPLVTTELLGHARVPNLMYLDHDGSRVSIDTDYFGKRRDPNRPTPGPFEKPGYGPVEIRVWPVGR